MMKKWIVLLFTIILCALILIACKKEESLTDTSTEEPESADEIPTSIMVGNREFSVDEINAGIKNVFNNELYYNVDDPESEYMMYNNNLILNQNIEYDLFYSPCTGDSMDLKIYGSEIFWVMPEMEHPWSPTDDAQLYEFCASIYEEGMGSGMSSGHPLSIDEYKSYFEDEKYVYLGRHSMCIEEIVQPVYEEKSEEWKSEVEKAIQMYMDEIDYYSGNSYCKLKPGKYKVYVKNFAKVDLNGSIFFEHEDGDFYSGRFLSVSISPYGASDITHVDSWDGDSVELLKSYLEKVKENAALCVEYEVKEK